MVQFILPKDSFINMTAPLTKWYRQQEAVNKISPKPVWHPVLLRKQKKLTNVARASLGELRIDYEDFLRTNKLPLWDKEHKLTKRLRELNKIPNATYETFRKAIENESPEICANAMIGLLMVVDYLLNKQIKALEIAFLKEGGLRERMTKARIDERKKNNK